MIDDVVDSWTECLRVVPETPPSGRSSDLMSSSVRRFGCYRPTGDPCRRPRPQRRPAEPELANDAPITPLVVSDDIGALPDVWLRNSRCSVHSPPPLCTSDGSCCPSTESCIKGQVLYRPFYFLRKRSFTTLLGANLRGLTGLAGVPDG